MQARGVFFRRRSAGECDSSARTRNGRGPISVGGATGAGTARQGPLSGVDVDGGAAVARVVSVGGRRRRGGAWAAAAPLLLMIVPIGPRPLPRVLGLRAGSLLGRLNVALQLRKSGLRLSQAAGGERLAEGIQIVRDRVVIVGGSSAGSCARRPALRLECLLEGRKCGLRVRQIAGLQGTGELTIVLPHLPDRILCLRLGRARKVALQL